MQTISIIELPILYFIVCAAILGLLVGSFLNVVILRLPKMMFTSWRQDCEEFLRENKDNPLTKQDKKFSLAFPASHCPTCNAPIKAWQNIPVISYVFLQGKCASCKTKIALRYPVIEFITGVLTAFAIYYFSFSVAGALAVVFTWCLICLTVIDTDHQLLPDSITLPLLWLGLIANSYGIFTDLNSALWGAVFGYLSLWSVYWGFKVLTGKEGMGHGDFKLLAALGAWMGAKMLIPVIIMSAFVGAVLGIAAIMIAGRDRAKPMPFGPYLAIAGWVCFYWGDPIIDFYLSVVGLSPQ